MVKRLLFLNGLAAICIATYHAAAYGFSALFEWTDRYRPVTVPNYDQVGSIPYYLLLFVRNLDAFAIPAFIFVTGYFVAFLSRGEGSAIGWKTIFSRIRILLVPFVLWTSIRLALMKDIPDNVHDIFGHYYYIVLVIQFYLLAPFLVPLARKSWILLIAAAGVVEVVTDGIFLLNYFDLASPLVLQVQGYLPLWFFPRRILLFAVGVVAGLRQKEFIEFLARYKWALVTISVVLFSLSFFEYEFYAQLTGQEWLGPTFRGIANRTFGIFAILAILSMDINRFFLSNPVSWLGGRSFGIYLANIPTIYPIAVLLYSYFPSILGNQYLYQFILVTAGLGVPVALMFLLSKSRARGYYRFVFG
jgi:peptidoglycan/LPS O-acetylase OafA/YrhL